MALERLIIVTARRQVRIDLAGQLVDFDSDHPTGLSEHRVNKQGGALHQDQGSPPQKFAFSCLQTQQLLTAAGEARDLSTWYRELRTLLTQEDPFCLLVHPRLGSMQVVCEGLQSKEAPGEEIDAIRFTVRFAEDGLREPVAQSMAGAAQTVAQKSTDLTTLAQSEPAATRAAVAQVTAAADSFVQVAALVAAGDSIQRLTLAARTLEQTVLALPADAAYAIRAQASQVSASAIDTVRAAQLGRPRLIPYLVPRTTSVAELATSLYGGRLSRAFGAEILLLNAIPVPYRVPALSILWLSDPAEAVKHAT